MRVLLKICVTGTRCDGLGGGRCVNLALLLLTGSIWILDPTGQGDRAIVRQDVAIERGFRVGS